MNSNAYVKEQILDFDYIYRYSYINDLKLGKDFVSRFRNYIPNLLNGRIVYTTHTHTHNTRHHYTRRKKPLRPYNFIFTVQRDMTSADIKIDFIATTQ